MIFGQNLLWIKQPFPHEEIRFNLVHAVLNNQAPNRAFDESLYLYSLKLFFIQIQTLRQASFERDYRRRSVNFQLEMDETPEVTAYADPKFLDTGFVSLGMIMAVNDACQSIVSDSRSLFALNIDDGILQNYGHAPNVVWSPSYAGYIDPFRYINYDVMLEAIRRTHEYPIGLLHKFVSASTFRQKLGDLLSAFATIWISSHEDAHHFLGHMDHFNTPFGAFPQSETDYFREFINRDNTPEGKRLRAAAEVTADDNACYVLVDHVCDSEMFDMNSFLFKHFSHCDPAVFDDEEALKKAKTIYLFRLCMVASTISLAIFERNTIKNGAGLKYYPTLTTRLINNIMAISGRIQTVSQLHPARKLYVLSDKEWHEAFLTVYDDIHIVLRYILEIGFVLQDGEINIKTVREALDFDFNKQMFSSLLTCLSLQANLPDKVADLPEEVKEEVIRDIRRQHREKGVKFENESVLHCLSNIAQLSVHNSHAFLKSRLKVNKSRIAKVEESYKQEILQSEKMRIVCAFLSAD